MRVEARSGGGTPVWRPARGRARVCAGARVHAHADLYERVAQRIDRADLHRPLHERHGRLDPHLPKSTTKQQPRSAHSCKSSEEHSAVTPAATRPRIPPGPLRQPEPAETCQTRTRAAHMRVEPSVTSRPYVERLGRRLLRSEGGLRRGRVDGRRRWLLGVPLRWLRQ